ncbi:MAG: poly[(R)-3-hydroxyalkanoate] polymerase subunit PhaC [Solirubrobacteraceae bacterium]|jgi:polyhydroxyalkanoate synthase|nr:poly[(R)-3-hydroxyalkanoate] polymerase subunit PhaC [Solirubrobacteraceae bacterium]
MTKAPGPLRLLTAGIETVNIVLTAADARIGATPRDLVWSHRKTSLYRYRSSQRRHPVPVLLVFALINRPEIFDLRPGNSFVEYLLEQGFDVYLLDWGVPGPEDAETGLEYYVCDALPWGMREVLRSSGAESVTLLGWCIGGTLCALHAALEASRSPARNIILLTTPIDPMDSLYRTWVGRDSFDVDLVTDKWDVVPGLGIDIANKLMKPVTNFWTAYRRLAQNVYDGRADRVAFQSMQKWISDNPPFPARAFREWVTWIYKERRLVNGGVRLRGRRADLRRITQSLLIVTADGDHIVPRANTIPLFDHVLSADVTDLALPGGHIGLMAGSGARQRVWPQIGEWLAARSSG